MRAPERSYPFRVFGTSIQRRYQTASSGPRDGAEIVCQDESSSAGSSPWATSPAWNFQSAAGMELSDASFSPVTRAAGERALSGSAACASADCGWRRSAKATARYDMLRNAESGEPDKRRARRGKAVSLAERREPRILSWPLSDSIGSSKYRGIIDQGRRSKNFSASTNLQESRFRDTIVKQSYENSFFGEFSFCLGTRWRGGRAVECDGLENR